MESLWLWELEPKRPTSKLKDESLDLNTTVQDYY